MSDGLTATPTREPLDPAPDDGRRPTVRVAVLQAVVVVAVFAAAGAAAGWVWFRVWDAPKGVASGGQWFTNEAGLRDDFTGVAWYVLIASGVGLVLGALAAWLLRRSELVTFAAVLAGSVLGAWLMLEVGQHLSPEDPHVLARSVKDGTELKGALLVDSWPPRAALPFGALLGLTLVYLASVGRAPTELRSGPGTLPPEEQKTGS